MAFDYHVHGLWILGSIMFFLGSLIAIFWEYEPLGSEWWSNAIALVLAFILYLVAAMCWIAAAVNAREEER